MHGRHELVGTTCADDVTEGSTDSESRRSVDLCGRSKMLFDQQ